MASWNPLKSAKSFTSSVINSITGQNNDSTGDDLTKYTQSSSDKYKDEANALADSTATANDLYDEASSIAARQANNAGSLAGEQALAASKIGGGGRLGNALRASQAASNASRESYNSNLNNAASLAQQQSSSKQSQKANALANALSTAVNGTTQGQSLEAQRKSKNAENKMNTFQSAFKSLSGLFS